MFYAFHIGHDYRTGHRSDKNSQNIDLKKLPISLVVLVEQSVRCLRVCVKNNVVIVVGTTSTEGFAACKMTFEVDTVGLVIVIICANRFFIWKLFSYLVSVIFSCLS